MKRDLLIWQLAGITFTAVLGTALHFLYDYSGLAVFSPVSAVNESTWEHMKLAFFPTVIFAVVQSFFFAKDYKSFWAIKLIGIIIAVFGIPVLFYTLRGAFGKTPDFVNIAIFFVSVIVAYLVEKVLFEKRSSVNGSVVAIILIILLAIAFVVFTYFPPHLPLFLDPITGTYGL